LTKFLARRLLLGLLTLWAITILIFAGTEILPGDVASAVLGQSATEELKAALRVQMGLDRPMLVSIVAKNVRVVTLNQVMTFRYALPLMQPKASSMVY
jgi:ABC-type dipeptide/oligopeptide/nickel transport system permease component